MQVCGIFADGISLKMRKDDRSWKEVEHSWQHFVFLPWLELETAFVLTSSDLIWYFTVWVGRKYLQVALCNSRGKEEIFFGISAYLKHTKIYEKRGALQLTNGFASALWILAHTNGVPLRLR